MLRIIAVAIACVWAWAGWKNMPRLEHPQSTAAGLAIAVSCLVSWWVGVSGARASARAEAYARADARAAARSESRSQAAAAVNLYMGVPSEIREQSVPLAGRGLESAPWIGAPKVAMLEQDLAESMMEDGQLAEEVEAER